MPKNSYYGYTFESEQIDNYIFRLILVFLTNLIEIKKFKKTDIFIEEYRVTATQDSFPSFFYAIENKKLGLSGYLGREKNGVVTYLIMDHARFKYVEMEGFDYTREDTINKFGVFRKLKTVTDFIKFMGGEPDYKFDGGYILGEELQKGQD